MSSRVEADNKGDGAHLIVQAKESGPHWITVFGRDDETGLGFQRPALAAEWARVRRG